MESVKKAETALCFANTAGLFAFTIYFYRSQTAMQAQITKMADAMRAIVDAVGEFRAKSTEYDQLSQVVQKMDTELNNISHELSHGTNAAELSNFARQMELITKAMEDAGIEVDEITDSSYVQGITPHRSGRVVAPKRGITVPAQQPKSGGLRRTSIEARPTARNHQVRFSDEYEVNTTDGEEEEDVEQVIRRVRNARR